MNARLSILSVLTFGALMTACADAGSPLDPTVQTASEIALAKSGSAPSGGGNGGGGGGGGGGGAPAPAVGKIRAASAGAVCDAGTSMGITIRKGIQDRSEIIMSITGPANGPIASSGNFLYWSFTIVDEATGARLLGYGTSSQFAGVNALITISGASTTPGQHAFKFLAQNHELAALTDFNTLLASPAVETCTATINVTAN